jgi:hypothetical protein
MCDLVRPALWVGGIALVITLLCAIYIFISNAGSRNLALGLGALAGACLIFALQIWFELQGSKITEDFPVQYDVDFQDKWIRKRPLRTTDGMSQFVSAEASKIISAATPPFRSDQAVTITHDMTIFSLVSYLLYQQRDWQLDTSSFRTDRGITTRWAGLSTPKECTKIDGTSIRQQLRKTGNIFADAAFGQLSDSLCLPPNSSLTITSISTPTSTSRVLSLTSPVCEISFYSKDFIIWSSTTPGNNNAPSPQLPDGTVRYANVDHGVRATITYFALRAQDRDLSKYQSWAKRVVAGATQWFE